MLFPFHHSHLKRWSSRLITAAALFAIAGPATSQSSEPTASLPYGPGVQELTVSDDRTDRPLSGHVWYPTSTPDQMTQAEDGRVWKKALADPKGVQARGPFPLIVVSHGTYGNTFNQAWLGSALSRRGYVVAMVNHPGTSTWLKDMDHARQLWDRPVDMSRLISHLLSDRDFGPLIDNERIFAAGHSLGGITAMQLAGADFSSKRFHEICQEAPELIECTVLGQWSVAITETDRKQMDQTRHDERIKKVISLDLGGTQLLSPVSLSKIDIPVLVLGAGRGVLLNQDRESRALVAALPKEQTHHVELDDGGHFDFMGLCSPGGYAFLKENEPGDEMVCVKGGEARAAQHTRIVDEIENFLNN